jgi:ubiquinone/menaquinone biosynthesis C-methylase UbiE
MKHANQRPCLKHSFLFVLFATLASAQVARHANERYQTPEGREAVAKGLVRPGRDDTQRPAELVAALGLKPGMTVADIGTGAGYMLPFLSRAVGPSGRVIAEDIFDDFLDKARKKAGDEKLTNVTFVRGGETDPNLMENSVDVILCLDSYHHYDFPEKMLAGFHKALRPGGRLAIVEFYRREKPTGGGPGADHIRIDQDDLIKEVARNGFRFLSTREHIKDSQYLAIFEKN